MLNLYSRLDAFNIQVQFVTLPFERAEIPASACPSVEQWAPHNECCDGLSHCKSQHT